MIPKVVLSILHARELGLKIPITYDISAFDHPASIDLLEGLTNIYLPDFESERQHVEMSPKNRNYTHKVMESIKAMNTEVGELCWTLDGIAQNGVLIQHLVCRGM